MYWTRISFYKTSQIKIAFDHCAIYYCKQNKPILDTHFVTTTVQYYHMMLLISLMCGVINRKLPSADRPPLFEAICV